MHRTTATPFGATTPTCATITVQRSSISVCCRPDMRHPASDHLGQRLVTWLPGQYAVCGLFDMHNLVNWVVKEPATPTANTAAVVVIV
jgi:hypothetical protein